MYTKLLVPIDGSPTSMLALSEAAKLAQLSGASIELLYVADARKFSKGTETSRAYLDSVRPGILRDGEEMLDKARVKLEAYGITTTTIQLEVQGRRAADWIVDHARKHKFDLIVLGTHGRRGVERLLAGSDAEQVARCAPVPVMLVREREGEDTAS